ncbi:hypothetical protein BDZ97DRAFT_1761514 [Flammula alnicola]|nr:hypothetical protein BDZ97DRAFT_1761514 [Flammula alnicola]
MLKSQPSTTKHRAAQPNKGNSQHFIDLLVFLTRGHLPPPLFPQVNQPLLARTSSPRTSVATSSPAEVIDLTLDGRNLVVTWSASPSHWDSEVLDDIVGRCVIKGRLNGERIKRIEFAWCVRSFGSIDWFAPTLMDIANVAASSSTSSTPLDLHISICVTCLCNPEAVLPIPNCDVTIIRPSVYCVLRDLTDPRKPVSKGELPTTRPTSSDESKKSNVNVRSKLPSVEDGGGLAVCANGPGGLIREAANAVARIQMSG